MKKINSSDLTVGLIKLEANKRSQHDPHEANNFYCGFSPNEANTLVEKTGQKWAVRRAVFDPQRYGLQSQ